jgi:hypothetical protein
MQRSIPGAGQRINNIGKPERHTAPAFFREATGCEVFEFNAWR